MHRLAVVAILSVLLVVLASCGGGGSGSSSTAGTPRADGKQSAYERRCPDGGLDALPLDGHAQAAAAALTARRVGRSPQIDVNVRPAVGHDPSVAYLCGPRVAHRTIYVTTYDHRYDRGPDKSASLAQHRFLVSRFQSGYRIWWWEH